MKSAGSLRIARMFAAALIACMSSAPAVAAVTRTAKHESSKTDKPPEASPKPADTPPADAAPPYEPQLLRLAELLGALAYLQDLCGHHQGDIWRTKMAALLNAEAKTPLRKERLAGAFNRGFHGYALTYRLCTANAQAIISRFLTESREIARDVAHRYGPS
jgi:uncharacterized protein (TIGR02301 family)